MNTLTWAGGVAGALLAIGTLTRYLLRRAWRAGRWAVAAVRLPDTVDHLAVTVGTLTGAVDRLVTSVDCLQSHDPATLETL